MRITDKEIQEIAARWAREYPIKRIIASSALRGANRIANDIGEWEKIEEFGNAVDFIGRGIKITVIVGED